jgi:hypothetical protein
MRFGLPAPAPPSLLALFKKADRRAAYFEATQLAGFSAAEARRFFGTPSGRTPRLVPLPAADAQRQFLERFRRLAA